MGSRFLASRTSILERFFNDLSTSLFLLESAIINELRFFASKFSKPLIPESPLRALMASFVLGLGRAKESTKRISSSLCFRERIVERALPRILRGTIRSQVFFWKKEWSL